LDFSTIFLLKPKIMNVLQPRLKIPNFSLAKITKESCPESVGSQESNRSPHNVPRNSNTSNIWDAHYNTLSPKSARRSKRIELSSPRNTVPSQQNMHHTWQQQLDLWEREAFQAYRAELESSKNQNATTSFSNMLKVTEILHDRHQTGDLNYLREGGVNHSQARTGLAAATPARADHNKAQHPGTEQVCR
jgi:hypothetical protein